MSSKSGTRNSKKTSSHAKNVQKKKSPNANQKLAKSKLPQPDFAFSAVLLKVIHDTKVSKVGDKLELYKLSDPTLKNVAVTRKDIPFWKALFAKGTQAPTIRLYLTPANVSSDAGGLTFTTLNLNVSACINFSDLANVFDEYRVIGGLVQYDAREGLTASRSVQLANGVIDYGDTTAFSSFAESEAYDTKKKFYTVPYVVDVKPRSVKWPVHFERLPDQEWTPVATTTTFATWKCYSYSATNNSITTGVLTGHLDIQFRGSD